jgi:hypothetical protein
MNFIKKIADNDTDTFVHLQFQRFSRGEFPNRAPVKVKKTKDKFTINTGPEFANELVYEAAKKLGNDSTKVTGAIVSTSDLKDKLEYENIKQFQGVKRYLINKDMTGDAIAELVKEFPKTFFGLSFSVDKDDTVLKIKPKAPKSGKPGKDGEMPKPDFCKLITKDSEWGKGFVLESDNFSKAEFAHTFIIEKISIPEGLKEEKDFAKIRELSIREGKIVRKSIIDEKEGSKEIEFRA